MSLTYTRTHCHLEFSKTMSRVVETYLSYYKAQKGIVVYLFKPSLHTKINVKIKSISLSFSDASTFQCLSKLIIINALTVELGLYPICHSLRHRDGLDWGCYWKSVCLPYRPTCMDTKVFDGHYLLFLEIRPS
jgi:hypothetical protein